MCCVKKLFHIRRPWDDRTLRYSALLAGATDFTDMPNRGKLSAQPPPSSSVHLNGDTKPNQAQDSLRTATGPRGDSSLRLDHLTRLQNQYVQVYKCGTCQQPAMPVKRTQHKFTSHLDQNLKPSSNNHNVFSSASRQRQHVDSLNSRPYNFNLKTRTNPNNSHRPAPRIQA